LFHDAGKLVILNLIADVQRKRKQVAPEPLIEAAFKIHHVSVGENACRAWGLPEPLISAVSRHHSPILPNDKLGGCVALGNRIAHIIESGNTSISLEKDDPFCTVLDLDSEELGVLLTETKQRLEAYSAALA
jgi:HD-like signal output (HDOD) protein